MMVATEKKPKVSAEMAEKPRANTFLIFNWRITDTTDNRVTSKSSTAKIIMKISSL